MEVEDLKKEIENIKERNKRVELDKKWETKLLKLQQQYDNRLIETTDLSKDQIKSLINLYKKQIRELSKSNAIRKEKLLQYRRKLQTNT